MNTKQKHELKKLIRELSSIRGRHTELVSVYVPAGYDLNKIINHLEQEQGTASNIKDARTRKNVIDSLERAIRHLRLYKHNPPNGLAVFSGNASDNESKIDIKVWSFEPPQPLNSRLYRCDQTFILDILKEMMDTKECFGLIVMDRREGTIGLLKGTRIESLMSLTSGVPGKTRAGGQSSNRFARLREAAAKEFYNRIADVAKEKFLGNPDIKGILVGGPGPTKEDFLMYMNQQLKDKIIGILDITYTDESGLHELVDKGQDLLAKEEIIEEKKLLNDFFTRLVKDPEKVTYGAKEVERALDMGAVEKLLISDSLDEIEIERLQEKAEALGSNVFLISTETREGVQLRDFGGLAAILRYGIN
ncbi:MAG: peptide chain release factor aRF-1 [Candidatus Nanoarchaeia archaeon]|nr:peptide chain release factor aRF-1 [Candidatus Nanoarchaeia archaeon]